MDVNSCQDQCKSAENHCKQFDIGYIMEVKSKT